MTDVPTDPFRDDMLKGRVVFVSGGSSGVNLGVATRFAEKGAHVTLVSRTEEKLIAAADTITSAGGSADYAVADVRDAEAVRAALELCHERHGLIDVVLSGAAGNFLAPVNKLSSNGFRTVIDIDLIGTYNVLKHSYDLLRRPGAALISISAPQAVRPMAEQSHAGAAKAGINMLTKNLALEWGGEGIRVNAISPGYIANTEGTSRLIDTPEKSEALLRKIPVGRLGEKTEIADLALFLASDRAAYITGAIFDCDGGLTLN
ncbi:SDR family oxidoreductase [Nocardia sp. CA-135953]|uniref:SDR family oxidoreductase n=1 Tax=Nocardia sp. CA-135953 TaxID=3239978 RepID=UPI003D958B9B